jgi:signal transduction histidine kinase
MPEFETQTLKGNQINVRMNLRIEQKYAENWSQVLIAINDITAQKYAELQEYEAKRLSLELDKEYELNKAKKHILDMLSHEYRTPLSIILSSSQLLKMKQLKFADSSNDKHIRIIGEQVRHLENLLDQSLDAVRFGSGEMNFQPEKFDLVQFVHSVAMAFANKLVINFNEHSIVEVMADRILIRYILVNLLANAIKYSSDDKTVDIRIENISNHVQIIVRDYGIGISPQDQKHVFDLFYRGANISNIPGTGLGLNLVKECVELHNGSINLESVEGVGSTFYINLPILLDDN